MDTDKPAEITPTQLEAVPTSQTTVPAAVTEPVLVSAAAPDVISPTSVYATPKAPATATSTPQAVTPQLVNSAPSTTVQPISPMANTAPVVISSPSDSGTPTAPTVGASSVGDSPAPKSKKRWLLPTVVAAILIVVLAGGYVFGLYLPNQPKNVFNSSLVNSGKGVDVLTDYATAQTKTTSAAKGATFDGTAKYSGNGAAMEATTSGAFDKEGNGTLKINANVAGEKFTANMLSIPVKGSDTPDLYVQLGGVKSVLDSYGLSDLDSLDGSWIAIDHTLLNSYASELDSSTGTTTSPTGEQITDAVQKVQDVNKQYLFSSSQDKAVLVYSSDSFVGKETVDGRSVNHYKVGYNKAHLQAYVMALKSALDNSSLNDWSKKANDGKSVSAYMDFDSLNSDIKSAKADYKFDVYTDTKQKLVHSVKFNVSDGTSPMTLTVAQEYTGGSKYPLSMTISGKTDGKTENSTIGLTLDTSTNKSNITINSKEDGETLTLNMNIAPSTSSVKVTAPASSTPLMDVLGKLGLGDDASTSSTALDDSVFSLSQ